MLDNVNNLATWKAVFSKGTQLKYRKGEFIIRPGEHPQGVFFIESGLVKAFYITKYGEENLLIIRQKHEIFPMIWAITGQERNIIYQTLVPTTVWRITRDEYKNFVNTHPEALASLLTLTMEMYRRHSERIINLGYRTVKERLVSFLLIMSHGFGEHKDDGLLINVPLRQQDIAGSINASRETTSRELSVLEKKGLLKSTQQYILLTDVKALHKYL